MMILKPWEPAIKARPNKKWKNNKVRFTSTMMNLHRQMVDFALKMVNFVLKMNN